MLDSKLLVHRRIQAPSMSVLRRFERLMRRRLEYSSNLRNWSIIQDDLAGNPMSSTLSDNLAFRFLAADPIPLGGFYRIVDRAPAPPDR